MVAHELVHMRRSHVPPKPTPHIFTVERELLGVCSIAYARIRAIEA